LAFLVACLCPSLTCAEMIKHGVLSENERWEGQIRLVGDVVVPKGITLEIAPNTILLYEQKDIMNYGKNPALPELVVDGELKMGEPLESIRHFDVLTVDDKTQMIKIAPYEVDTKILRDEFRAFKEQYLWLWSVLTGGVILALLSI